MTKKEHKRPNARLFVLLLFLSASALLHGAFILFPGFADLFNRTVGAWFRAALAAVTALLPFSLAEILIVLIPVFFILLIIFAVRAAKRKKAFSRYLLRVLLLPASLYLTFVLTFASSYRAPSLTSRLSLDSTPVNAETLYATTLWAKENAENLGKNLPYGENGTEMPYTWQEMTEKLNDAYESLSDRYDVFPRLRSSVKPVALSGPMATTGIVGVYTFFTGESNVCTVYPDYSTVFTAAHEMAHQRGVGPENEANFVAFLALSLSDDDYLRYVGFANLTDYLMSSLRKTDTELYKAARADLSPLYFAERSAYSKVYNTYHNEIASSVSGAVNDGYLKLQGTGGTVTYGLVTHLAVAYYYTENK